MSKASDYAKSQSTEPPEPLAITSSLGARVVELSVTKKGELSFNGVWLFPPKEALEMAEWLKKTFDDN